MKHGKRYPLTPYGVITKHRILKNLRSNKDIVITKPDKRAGVVILNKNDYIKMTLEIIGDKSKFKQLKKRCYFN